MPEFRQDPISGRWVIVASKRWQRPRHYEGRTAAAYWPECPFCEGNEAMTPPEIQAKRTQTAANTPGWRVRVVPNKYPALENDGHSIAHEQGFYQKSTGIGVHEVIIESPQHVVDMHALTENQIAEILSVYRARMAALRDQQQWRCMLLYKNQGEGAGATLDHVHSQLLALPTVPSEITDELFGACRHFESSGRCIYCDIIEDELRDGKRLVAFTERFVALCPFAPRFSYETWILPRGHQAVFEQSLDEDILDLARALRHIIGTLNHALENPPFNYIIHSLPPKVTANFQYHWHIEILPQLAKAAGLEWGSGIYLNPVSPEDAARRLRERGIE